ncbi:MAG TPA: hypothetical protein VK327_15485 [Candidatus Paceibacterota bacterium]|nr:hypothetical protein [Candidatus Paceibacterota bacterium]
MVWPETAVVAFLVILVPVLLLVVDLPEFFEREEEDEGENDSTRPRSLIPSRRSFFLY